MDHQDSQEDQLMRAMIQDEMDDQFYNPRIDMETGEVYEQELVTHQDQNFGGSYQ